MPTKKEDIQSNRYDPSRLTKDQPQWQKYTKATGKAMDAIAMGGVLNYNESQLRAMIYSMARTAKARERQLIASGLEDSPALQHLRKEDVLNTQTSKLKVNGLRHKAYVLAEFLESKTSTVEGYKDFLSKTIERWIGTDTTEQDREKIWDLYNRLRPYYSSYFTLDYSSAELAQDISELYQVLSQNQFDVDVAIEKLTMTLEQIEEENDIIREEIEDAFELEETSYEKFIRRASTKG